MGVYSDYVLPRLVHWTCGLKPFMRQRAKVVPLAQGCVLEVGIGSGLNLVYYDAQRVRRVIGVDPSAQMTRRARRAANALPIALELVNASAERMPLPGQSVDTVVVTYSLCTIADPQAALAEMARVLRPGGQLVFCEHGLAPDADVRKWQHRITPVWRRLAGGCHLDRDIPALLLQAGFAVSWMDRAYLPGWRPATFNYWGVAAPG